MKRQLKMSRMVDMQIKIVVVQGVQVKKVPLTLQSVTIHFSLAVDKSKMCLKDVQFLTNSLWLLDTLQYELKSKVLIGRCDTYVRFT